MPIDVASMQQDKRRRLEDITGKSYDAAKRTTIILEKDERDFIDSLVREGKEPGIKPLISKMIEIYRSMMIYDWRFPGEYYCGISRTAFINVELFNILLQQIPKEKWREAGHKMGDALKVSLETTLDLQASPRENWASIFKRLKVQGFGDFYLKDKYLLVKTPFIGDAELLAGILEGLLKVDLDVKTSVSPIVLEIKKESTAPSNLS